MNQISTPAPHANSLLKQYEQAMSLPRVACRVCGKLNCLDFGPRRNQSALCETCEEELARKLKADEKQKEILDKIKNSGLAPVWHKSSWDTFRELTATDKQVKKMAMDSWHRDKGLLLIGPAGIGKTHLLACIAVAFAKKNIAVKFIKARDFISEITESWKARTAYNPVDIIAGYSVILIDDLTFEADPPEFIKRSFNQLIDKIYETENSKLFVSTNLPMSGSGKTLETYLGVPGQRSPFVSRLYELTLSVTWPENFPDRRKEIKK